MHHVWKGCAERAPCAKTSKEGKGTAPGGFPAAAALAAIICCSCASICICIAGGTAPGRGGSATRPGGMAIMGGGSGALCAGWPSAAAAAQQEDMHIYQYIMLYVYEDIIKGTMTNMIINPSKKRVHCVSDITQCF